MHASVFYAQYKYSLYVEQECKRAKIPQSVILIFFNLQISNINP